MARTRKNIVKNLDKLTREILRKKQEDSCEYCGIKCFGRQSHPHHIRSRKYYESRWDLRNLVLLCAKCHRAYHDGNIGKDWFKEKYPLCWEWIEWCKQTPPETYRQADLLELEAELKEQWNED